MSNQEESNRELNEPWTAEMAVPIVRRRLDWPGVAGLVLALVGLWIAATVAVRHAEPTTAATKIYTAVFVVSSLVALAVAVARLRSSASSRLRHVFCGRRVLALGGFQLLVAALLGAALARRDPLGHFFSSGRIDARDIVDFGFGSALIVCAVGAGIALLEGRETIDRERNWHRSLGISLT